MGHKTAHMIIGQVPRQPESPGIDIDLIELDQLLSGDSQLKQEPFNLLK